MSEWDTISANPKFQALPDEKKESIRQDLWNRRIAPNVPKDKLEAARKDFDEKTSLKKTKDIVRPSTEKELTDVLHSDGGPRRNVVTDMILGTPGAAAKAATQVAGGMMGQLRGDPEAMQKARAKSAKVFDPMTEKLQGLAGKAPDPTGAGQGAMKKVSEALSKPGEMAKKYVGAEAGAAVDNLVDLLTFYLPAKVGGSIKGAAKALHEKATTSGKTPSVDDIMAELQKQGATPEEAHKAATSISNDLSTAEGRQHKINTTFAEELRQKAIDKEFPKKSLDEQFTEYKAKYEAEEAIAKKGTAPSPEEQALYKRQGDVAEMPTPDVKAPDWSTTGKAEEVNAARDAHEFNQWKEEKGWQQGTPLDYPKEAVQNPFHESVTRAKKQRMDFYKARNPDLFKDQAGKADPALLGKMGLVSAGIIAGNYLNPDDPFMGTILGGLGAAGLIKAAGTPSMKTFTKQAAEAVSVKAPTVSVKDNINALSAAHRQTVKEVDRMTNMLTKMMPDDVERSAAGLDIDRGNVTGHAPAKQAFIDAYKLATKATWDAANKEGVVNGFIENYIHHMYDDNKGLLDMFTGDQARGGKSPSSSHAKERTFATVDDAAKAMGLKPKTTDAAELYRINAMALRNAASVKRMMNDLGKVQDVQGRPAITGLVDGQAPKGYSTVDTPFMRGKAVLDDIQPDLTALLKSFTPSPLTNVALATSVLAKGLTFTSSLFHADTLVQGLAGAMNLMQHPVKTVGEIRNSWQMIKDDHPHVQEWNRKGLVMGSAATDFNKPAYIELNNRLGKFVGEVIPGGQIPFKISEAIAKATHKVTFEVLQPTFKLMVANQKLAKVLAKDGTQDVNKAMQDIAQFANDTFGTQDMMKLAQTVEHPMLKKMALNAVSSRGSAYMQLAMIAPDWAISTLRPWYITGTSTGKALGQAVTRSMKGDLKGAGQALKDYSTDQRLQMYRSYLLQSAALSFAIGDTINYQMSGHHMWENKEGHRTEIDHGDGTFTQAFKHFTEGIHLVDDPIKFAFNKLGPIPKELASQAFGKEYPGGPNMGGSYKEKPDVGDRAAHAAQMFEPIGVKTAVERGPVGGTMGFIGLPPRGYNKQQLADMKREQELKDAKKRRDRARNK